MINTSYYSTTPRSGQNQDNRAGGQNNTAIQRSASSINLEHKIPIKLTDHEQKTDEVLQHSNIPIKVGPQTSDNFLQNSNALAREFAPLVREAVKPSFAQRHLALVKLFSGVVTVLACPVLVAVNAVVTPFLMGAAFFSKTCGSGELAKDIGKSTIAKALWGEFADDLAAGKMASGKMGILAFTPLLGPEVSAISASARVYSSIRDFLLRSPLPVAPNENFRKPASSTETKGGRAALLSDHVKPNNLGTKTVDAFLDEKGQNIGYVDAENNVYDLKGEPFTGIAPALDGRGMAAYGISDGNQKVKQLDIVTASDRLWIAQGRTGDCYVLTMMYGLLKQPAINKWFAENSWFKPDGTLVLNFPRTKTVEENLECRWQVMGQKGYSISTGTNVTGEAVIHVTVSKEKLNDILKVKQLDEGDKGSGRRAYSTSVFVLAMEHFSGNMATLPVGDLNESFAAHSKPSRDLTGVAALFGCELEQCDSITTNKISQWKTDKKCLADSKDSPTPGFIYCNADRHAYALHDIISDQSGNIQEVQMVNPWDTSVLQIETWPVKKFMAATLYEVTQTQR